MFEIPEDISPKSPVRITVRDNIGNDFTQTVAAKRAAGRPKDLGAIPELEAILENRKMADKK
jgi:hypothetical protein